MGLHFVRKAIPLAKWAACVAMITQLGSVQARTLTTEQKLTDFRSLVNTIESGYGPLEFKRNNKIVDYAELNHTFERELAATTTNAEFYYKMIEYVASYRDGHFGAQIPSTKVALIPIVTDLVAGKVLITKIDRNLMSEKTFPFDVGDEIVNVDDQTIEAFLDTHMKWIATGNELTRRRIASWLVFSRRGARIPLPQAPALQLQIRRGTSDIIESATLPWAVTGQDPEQMPEASQFSDFHISSTNFDQLDNKLMLENLHPSADRSFQCSGSTRIDIPKDATVIMMAPFVAYYYPTAKGNVGYLRIPHYSPGMEDGNEGLEATLTWLAQYEFAVSKLEANTVGLIIDQDHNCGGSVWVAHKMIALFMDRPFQPMQFELLASKQSFLDFQGWANETKNHTLEKEAVERVLNLIRQTWLTGTSYLTPKTAIDGETLFAPNPIRYTKPIVMLIDEMSGSGGDAFPAMMQGLGRAKLFGQRTSGLGGHVTEYPAPLFYSSMTFRMTKSLFYDPKGVAIENHGAVPDQEYVISREDIMYGFKKYQQTYTEYLLSLLP